MKSTEITAEDVHWVVNDLGELGVEIHGRHFFLYKGYSLEYQDAVHEDDQTRMKVRWVGKREFGEVQYPASWVAAGKCQHRYTEPVSYHPEMVDEYGHLASDNLEYRWHNLPEGPISMTDNKYAANYEAVLAEIARVCPSLVVEGCHLASLGGGKEIADLIEPLGADPKLVSYLRRGRECRVCGCQVDHENKHRAYCGICGDFMKVPGCYCARCRSNTDEKKLAVTGIRVG